MRLLDKVAQYRSPVLVTPDGDPSRAITVTGPSDYAADVAACPLRYVLGDDLTRASAELAFAEGDRLAGCLDLIRIPAPLLWIEWNDAVHKRVVYESGSSTSHDPGGAGRQVGVLLRATTNGRSGLARTFWSDLSAEGERDVVLSPIETHFDLRGDFAPGADVPGVLSGELASVTDDEDAGVSALLDCVRFRFDERWVTYYRAAAITPSQQRTAVSGSLEAVARDAPLLLAFFLLLSARDATRSLTVARDAINRKRQYSGRAPLLDHIEVRSTIDSMLTATDTNEGGVGTRRASRLHHVRGHIVRRANRVFWRTPHLRGRASAGIVRSRTVFLSFECRPNAD
jgi:hypothetical protein